MAQKKTTVSDWMTMMEDWFSKLPNMPKGGREAIVQITPWIALIFGILGVLAGLAGFGILAALSPFTMMAGNHAGVSLLTAALGLVSSAFLLAAFPGTNKHSMQGWKLLFYSEALSTLSAVFALSLSGVIVSLVGFYLLFQIKGYYK